MARRQNKQVDLVIYKGGERIVVGKAAVNADGSIQAQVAKDLREDIKNIIYGDLLDNLSFNPTPAKPAPVLTYHEATITPKIQE